MVSLKYQSTMLLLTGIPTGVAKRSFRSQISVCYNSSSVQNFAQIGCVLQKMSMSMIGSCIFAYSGYAKMLMHMR